MIPTADFVVIRDDSEVETQFMDVGSLHRFSYWREARRFAWKVDSMESSRYPRGRQMTIDEYNKLCAALPVDVNWGDPITPEVVAAILESRASNAGGAVAYMRPSDGALLHAESREMCGFRRAEWTPLYTHPAPTSKEPVADEREASEFDSPLSDFQEGQWWVKELDALGSTGTDDQKRAIAVVHHMLRSARAALATAQTGEHRDAFNEWFAAKIANGMTPEEIAFGMHVNNIAVCKEREEVETLRAVAKEYDALIRHMDAGGDFHAFHAAMLAAAPAKPEGV